jgi:hypothetical protein
MNVELWLREFFDEKTDSSKDKKEWSLGDPNKGKSIQITVGTETYSRFPIKTELVKKETI